MRSVTQKLEDYLKIFDIYGQNVQLNLNKKQKYNTVIGGVLSLLVFTLLLIGCWFFGKELIYKQNPSVISQERPVDCPKRIDVKPDNLIIMMGVANANAQYFSDPRLFTVNAIQQQQVSYIDQNTGLSSIKLVNQNRKIRLCNENDIGISDTKSYFTQLNYPVLYCFDTSEQPVYFEGDFNQQEFSQLIVYFDKCQNSTSSQIICQPKEVIDQTLMLSKVGVFMSDHVINPLNFKNPISNRGISLYASTSSSFPQEMSLYFTNQYIDTDQGVFYQEIEQISTFVFMQQTITPYFSSPNTLARVIIRLQKQKENYMKRSYLKLADVVAQIGGLLKILVLIGFLISNRISKLYYFKAIIDEIYQFKSSSDKVDLIPKDQSKIDQSNNQIITKQNPNQIQIQLTQQLTKGKQKNKSFVLNQFQKNSTPIHQLTQNSPLQKSHNNCNSLNNMNQSEIKMFQLESKNLIEYIINKTKHYFQSTHNILRYSFSNFLAYAFANKSKLSTQNLLFDQGIEKIQENFDILFIFNKLFEIDKMKQILFNSDQLKLFEYMPKPVISQQTILNEKIVMNNFENKENLNNQNNNLSSLSPIKKSQEKKTSISKQVSKKTAINTNQTRNRKIKSERQLSEEALEGLKNILQQNKISKVDQSLIKIIDPSIIQEINQSKYNFCLNNSEDIESTFSLHKSNSSIQYKSFSNNQKCQGQQQNFECRQKGKVKKLQSGFKNQDEVIDPYYNQIQQNDIKEILKTLTGHKQADENDLFEDNFIYFVDQDDISQSANIQSIYLSAIKKSQKITKQKRNEQLINQLINKYKYFIFIYL
ncbi:transmembrane protein, putative (macronuclear) [Tetrahymena thermophila SB210]|uniref:Transmembrane protein, putative n=1 Tax=Tetrahymena thermophila (strain SB210) TaxID=312017 RepID=Q22M03_TETTS|nr:transmembrane protein, putative [Tetrahymena thermophila SB210]EAR86659.2 transmembrane protein, putative [Tetrahymena thermophila SB210]|eukprot:XP_977217.2 transmembrane protein, putative [Tetrahymena thermophila SB210]